MFWTRFHRFIHVAPVESFCCAIFLSSLSLFFHLVTVCPGDTCYRVFLYFRNIQLCFELQEMFRNNFYLFLNATAFLETFGSPFCWCLKIIHVCVLTLGKLIQIMIKEDFYRTCSATMRAQYQILSRLLSC